MEKIIVVTGSSGFIGSAFVKKLLQKNYKVVGIDLIVSGIIHRNFQELIVDLTNQNELNKNFLDPEDSDKIYYVCHLAG